MVDIRVLDDTELALLQPLFRAAFGEDIGLPMLRWKYAQGRGSPWTLWHGNTLQAHCGVWPRQVLLQGEPQVAAQLIDLMAAPKQSGLALRGSPFAVLMRHLLMQLPAQGHAQGLAFGVPSARAMRLGELAGVYTAVDEWHALTFSARAVRGTRVTPLTSWGGTETAAAAQLWQLMREGLRDFALGVRDMDYLRRRYLCHPTRSYTVLLVRSRWWGTPLGVLVLGPPASGPELVDVICAPQAWEEVLLAGRHWLNGAGLARMHLMVTSVFAAQLAVLADACAATEFRIMGNPFSSQDCLCRLRGRWWLTGGDTDYR